VGPIGIILLLAAVVSAFLKAKNEQQARYHLTTDPPEGERRVLHRTLAERMTPEGETILRRARLYRILLYVFGLGALLATWKGY